MLAHLVILAMALAALQAARKDLTVADFEGDAYAPWTAEGKAFGSGPARGTLPGQMEVSGFEGRGLANSFVGGDDATGTLTSPTFLIQRRYLNALVGGGKFPKETCVNLLMNGRVVRSVSGPNEQPGGSERLEWRTMDVGGMEGQSVTIEVVDRRTGGWGHISVDQITQSDVRKEAEPASKMIVVDQRYLLLPVQVDAPLRRMKVVVEGQTVREFDIRLAEPEPWPKFWVSSDLKPFLGKTARVEVMLEAGSKALDLLSMAGKPPGEGDRSEAWSRPQFHFTSRRGWLNDPNGLVWMDGEYHLFYQHNPYGWDWGNMHWGHAVSRNLVQWNELPEALTPRKYGDDCFSGSAVVDKDNTSGWGNDGKPAMVLAYTSTGRGECMAYSNDRGRTWTEFEGNPVVKHPGRDPRLLWHPGTKRWVMAVYDETGGKQAIVFHTSPDLKTWTERSRVDGYFECPDLYELAVEGGKAGETRWVLSAADGEYALGTFDGERFTPEGPKRKLFYGDVYAAQTFSDAPDGRRLWIGWGRYITFPGKPFNQQMTVPCDLKLRWTDDGARLFANPVKELNTIRQGWSEVKAFALTKDERVVDGVTREYLDVRAEMEVEEAGSFAFTFRGFPVAYDAVKKTIRCGNVAAPLASEGGKVSLRILVDRGSVEVFGNGGRVMISKKGDFRVDAPAMAMSGTGATLRSLVVERLQRTPH